MLSMLGWATPARSRTPLTGARTVRQADPLHLCPDKTYLDTTIKCLQTFFTPEVRTVQGIMVKMPTEKISEYVENPVLKWVLYVAGDPRWNEHILEAMLSYGGMRGLGPGRGTDESKYRFTMSPWTRLSHRDALERYTVEFGSPGTTRFLPVEQRR